VPNPNLKMGGQISVENDLGTPLCILLASVKNCSYQQDGFYEKISTGKIQMIDVGGIRVNEKYKLLLKRNDEKLQVDPEALREAEGYTFFAFRNESFGLKLKASWFVDDKFLKKKEENSLIGFILPGVRVEDREFYGQVYEETFIANELVTYLVLNGVASSIEDAVSMGQLLLSRDVFERVVEYQDFENLHRFFRLNQDHRTVKALGRLEQTVDTWGQSLALRFHSHKSISSLQTPGMEKKLASPSRSTQSKLLSSRHIDVMRHLDGWLEKKGNFGFWAMRYLRVLPRYKDEDGETICWFENTVSLKAKGSIPTRLLQKVEVLPSRNKKRSNIIQITMLPEHNIKRYWLRAPNDAVCFRWLAALQTLARQLSPVGVVSKSALAFALEEELIGEFATLLRLRRFKKGDWICRKGSIIREFLILRQGRTGMYIEDHKSKNKLYDQLIPVCFFGERVFYKDSEMSPRKAASLQPVWTTSIRAEEDCEMLAISKKKREAFLKKYPKVAIGLHNLFFSGIDDCLKLVPFLKDTSPSQRAKLKQGLQLTALKKDQELFSEGDPGHEFYIVYKGSLEITRYDRKRQKEVVLKKVGKSDSFGEIALMLPGACRTANVRAVGDSLLLVMNEQVFRNYASLGQLDLNDVLMRPHIMNTLQQSRVPFFEAIPEEDMQDLVKLCKIESYKANTTLFEEGSYGEKFYIVWHGEVNVHVAGKLIQSLGSGKYFGEIALVLEQTPRTATCITTSQTILLVLEKQDFQQFFHDKREALSEVELRLLGNKCKMHTILHHPLGLDIFTRFLRSQHAEENVNFWTEVRKYRKWAEEVDLLAPVHHEKCQSSAQRIWKEYVTIGSNQEINIAASVRQAIEKEIVTETAHENTFAEAEKEIVTMISRDKLSTFRMTEDFQTLLETIGNYSDVAQLAKHKISMRGSPVLKRRVLTARATARKDKMATWKTVPRLDLSHVCDDEVDIKTKDLEEKDERLLTQSQKQRALSPTNHRFSG